MSFINRITDWFIEPVIRTGEADSSRRARLAVVYSAFGATILTVYAVLNLFLFRLTLLGGVLLFAAVIWALVPFFLRVTGSYRLAGHLFTAILIAVIFFLARVEGCFGFPLGTLLWILPVIIGAPHLIGLRAAFLWTLLCGVGFVTIYLFYEPRVAAIVHGETVAQAVQITPEIKRRIDLFSGIGLVLTTFTTIAMFESILTRSIKEKSEIEEELRRAQKLESIGLLAGGVAHDFNNLLSIVLTYANVLRGEIDADDPRGADVERIRLAGERAAELTHQLLQFSRKELDRPEPFDLNAIVREMAGLLQRSLEENIRVGIDLAPDLWTVKADRRQIQQVLLNLAVNSRDAMRGGGTLGIQTANIDLNDLSLSRKYELEAGRYVRLTFCDTGCGMSAEVRNRAFEPFFTTKPAGKGSGLGLSTAYGIIKKARGYISVESEEDEGAKFTIILPATEEKAADAKCSEKVLSLQNKPILSSYTLLLVEDDEGVRTATKRILTKLGLEVLTARCGEEALQICKNYANHIHIMLTDVIMPGMSGSQLAEQAVTFRPDMAVIYMSGYPDDETVRHGISQGSVTFIQKPFSEATLLKTLVSSLPPPVEQPQESLTVEQRGEDGWRC